MLPDRVSNPGPLNYESGALPIALRGPTVLEGKFHFMAKVHDRFTYLRYKLPSYNPQPNKLARA